MKRQSRRAIQACIIALISILSVSCQEHEVQQNAEDEPLVIYPESPKNNTQSGSRTQTGETVILNKIRVRLIRRPSATGVVLFKVVRVSDKSIVASAAISVSRLLLPTQNFGLGRLVILDFSKFTVPVIAGERYRVELSSATKATQPDEAVLVAAYCTCNDPNNFNPYPTGSETYENSGGAIFKSSGWLLKFDTENRNADGTAYLDQQEPLINSWLTLNETFLNWEGQEFVPLSPVTCAGHSELAIKNFTLGQIFKDSYNYSFDIVNAGTEPLDLNNYVLQNWYSLDGVTRTAGAGGFLLRLRLPAGQSGILQSGESIRIDHYFVISQNHAPHFFNILDIYSSSPVTECDNTNVAVQEINL